MFKRQELEAQMGTKRILKGWNPADAKYEYVLGEYTAFPLPGRPSAHYWRELARGNKTWADKNAKHYNITIQEDKNV